MAQRSAALIDVRAVVAHRRLTAVIDWEPRVPEIPEQAVGGVVTYTPRGHPLGEVMKRTLERLPSQRWFAERRDSQRGRTLMANPTGPS